jgi:organic hydroperoxide reductase OsmC/OhrA
VLADAGFDAAAPEESESEPLIRRNGLTPKTEETTGFAGSSLAEKQDRVLHIRGICTLRADGVKQVEQQLFNPHGSIFHFLSDEAPINGGGGIAPDACTYISAGIAFCFMTQFGRYAAITKKDLQDYRIVQDTHFSLGGASHGTGLAGTANPVATHVSLRTAEDDQFARQALDMAEQTCFLHALCRSTLKTKVRLREFN